MANFPLFQKTLEDSTPFGGTMAETDTPAPTGEIQGEETPETPQATEMPGNAGDQVRLKKIQQDRDLISKQLQFWTTARYVERNHWKRRFDLALTGNDMEPASMMYKKQEAIQGLLRIDTQLAQEERLLTQPSPIDLKGATDAASRKRRQEFVNTANEYIQIIGGTRIPIENEMQFVETGYGLNASVNKEASGEDDALGTLIKGIQVGEGVGTEGVTALALEGKTGIAAKYAAIQAQKEADAKAKDKDDSFPVLGQFKKPSELFSAMYKEYADALNTEEFSHMEKTKTFDGVMEREGERRAWSTDEKRDARAAVAAKWPGYEKYFPNFVEKGFTDVPVVEPAQGDLDVIRKKLQEPKAAEKK